MTDADEIKFSLGLFAVEDRFDLRVVQQGAGGRLEEGGAGQFDATFGHTDATLPLPRLAQFGLAAANA
jgi:hypothetical protein